MANCWKEQLALLAMLCCVVNISGALADVSSRGCSASSRVEEMLCDLSAQLEAMEQRHNATLARLSTEIQHVRSVLAAAPWVSEAEARRSHKLRNVSSSEVTVRPSHPDSAFSQLSQRALHDAAIRGDSQVLRQLLKDGASASARDRSGDTALHAAAARGHVEAADTLLGFGGDVQLRGRLLRTPLHCAAAHGHLRMVQRLLDAGAQANIADVHGDTPVALAAKANNTDVFERLLLSNASSRYVDRRGDTPLLSALRGRRWDFAKQLMERGASVAIRGYDRATPLLLAAREGQLDVLEAVLRQKWSRDRESIREALKEARGAGVVWALAQAEPEVVAGAAGEDALRQAAIDDRPDVLVALLQVGVNADARRRDGATALLLAAQRGHSECVVSIVQHRTTDYERESDLRVALTVTNSSEVVFATADVVPSSIRRPVVRDALRNAAARGRCDVMDALLDEGVNENESDLLQAATDAAARAGLSACIARVLRRNNTSVTRNYLARRALNVTDSADVVRVIGSAVPALFHAEESDHLLNIVVEEERCGIIDALQVVGVNVSREDSEGNTILDRSAQKGNTKCIPFLLAFYSGESKESAVRRALSLTNSIGVVEILFRLVPDVVRAVGGEALFRAAEECRRGVLGALLQIGDLSTQKDSSGRTALEVAAMNAPARCASGRNTSGLETLVDAGWEQEMRFAVLTGRCKTVAALVATGVYPDSVDRRGYTALAHAVSQNRTDCVMHLLDGGADTEVKIKQWRNGTALLRAAALDQLANVRALLAKGADANACTSEKNTALMYASRQNYVDIVRELLSSGADINAQNNDGFTALSSASYRNMGEVVRILIKAGANVNMKSKSGQTSLHLASLKGNADIVEMLLNDGADKNVQDNEGKTAYDLANIIQVRLLLKN